jgi:hypothetical protein
MGFPGNHAYFNTITSKFDIAFREVSATQGSPAFARHSQNDHRKYLLSVFIGDSKVSNYSLTRGGLDYDHEALSETMRS